jgi:hypothetical protein
MCARVSCQQTRPAIWLKLHPYCKLPARMSKRQRSEREPDVSFKESIL